MFIKQGAWIITGGTGTGVMQFVGEAVKEYQLSSGGSKGQVVALGIATWGIVDNKSALEGSNTVRRYSQTESYFIGPFFRALRSRLFRSDSTCWSRADRQSYFFPYSVKINVCKRL